MSKRTRVAALLMLPAIVGVACAACVPLPQEVSGSITSGFSYHVENELGLDQVPNGWVEDVANSKRESVGLTQSQLAGLVCKEQSHSGQQLTIRDAGDTVVALVDLPAPNVSDFQGTKEIFEFHPDAQAWGRWGTETIDATAKCETEFSFNLALDSEFYSVEVDGVPGAVRMTREELANGITLSQP